MNYILIGWKKKNKIDKKCLQRDRCCDIMNMNITIEREVKIC